ncbi:unnamed protein product [Trifolium pratense]|uniref:Uncharacterized protein n=1 Tax=Trifolium pratense TaxID=57577 RepID=A0ACB0KL05_TRIPR|nr:unnamed protein product [Trifolium pratense]
MLPVKKRFRWNLSFSNDDNLKELEKKTISWNHSPSTSKESVRHVSNMIMACGENLWGAKKRRTLVSKMEAKDCNEDSNSTDRLTRGDSIMDGSKVDEGLKRNSLDCNAVSKDCILPSEDANVSAEYTSTTHGETSPKRVENDKGENYTPKRKNTANDTATLVDDDYLIERSRCNVVETSTSTSSKRIRWSSSVDQPTSKSTDEKSCARNMEDSGRSQQKSLHLSLKPDIAKLCEILLLPDNVKSMVGKILEYIINNRICAEPVTMLQAFQLSLCSIAASLLKQKLDIEASLILAKKHLNFDCKKYAVDQINEMLWHLREKFLLLKENSNVIGSPEAFESSNRVHSNALIMPYVESTETYVSRIINESQKRKNQWRKLLDMQLENEYNLKKDFETKEIDFAKRYKIELAAYQKYYVMTKAKLEDYKAEYYKRLAELKRHHDERLKDFKTKKLEARQKFRESWTLDEVLETSGELSREEAMKLPNIVKSTDNLQEKATTLNSSSTDQKSNAGFDRVVSSRPCISISSSDEESDCQIIDNVVVNKSTTSDHEEVVHKSMTENTTLSPVTSVSRPVNLIEPQEKVNLKPLSSVELPPSRVIILSSNQSNHVSMVMEPIEKMQQLPSSSRFLSSNQDFSSQDALSSKICVASTGFQNQASKKPASNLEVGSRTHQLVPPISNMVIESHVSSVVRAQSSNTRNLCTQRLINNHPIQTAVQSASRNVPPLCNDPFRNQLETIRNHVEQNAKIREQMELHMKYKFEKDKNKIQAKFQEERQKTAYLKMMLVNAKPNLEFPGASQMLHLQGFNTMVHHLPIQQNATRPSLDTSSSSRGRDAATSQNSYASASFHNMVLSPALHTSYNTSEVFRDFSARLPISSASRNLHTGGEASHLPPYGSSTFLPASYVSGILHGMPSHHATQSRINSIASASRNHQAGGGVPYGLTSCSAAPCTSPASSFSSSLSQWLAKPISLPTAISKVGTHRGHGKENVGLSPDTHTLSFKDMHMNPNRK